MELQLAAGRVDLGTGVFVDGSGSRSLTPTEVRLLAYLWEAGRPVGQDELLTRVWEYSDRVVSRTVRVTVSRLRAKIEADPAEPESLRTLVGQGYVLVASQVVPAAPGLVGREREIGLLAEAGDRVAIVGPPGIGKSTLAAAARRAGSVRVPLAEARSTDELWNAVAGALDLEVRGPVRAAVRSAPTPPLLVLDDADTVLDGVEELLGEWSGPVWVTARTAPRGLTRLELGPLPPEACAALLVDGWNRLGQSTPDLGELVALSEGIPLVIELIAGWADLLDPGQIAGRLRRDSDWLQDADGTRSARHRSLVDAVALSWDLLDPADRAILSQATVFRGGFTPELAEAVIKAPRPVLLGLKALRERSLLQRDGDRLRLLGPIRDFAERFRDPEVDRRHAETFAALAESAEVQGPGQPAALAALDAERANLVAAWDWACAHDAAIARGLARDLGPLFVYRGGLGTWVERLDRTPDHPDIWTHRALANRLWGRMDTARSASERAIAEARSTEALDERGRVVLLSGDLAGATALHEEQLAKARLARDRFAECLALRRVAECHAIGGATERALDGFGRALALARELRDPIATTQARRELARQLHAVGRLDEALAVVEAEPGPVPSRVPADFLGARAMVLHHAGRVGEALAALDRAVDLASGRGARGPALSVRYMRASLEVDFGLPEAEASMAAVRAEAGELGLRLLGVGALATEGLRRLDVGDVDGSREAHRRALSEIEAFGQVPHHQLSAWMLCGAGELLRGDGDALLRRAEALADELGLASGAEMVGALLGLVERREPRAALWFARALEDVARVVHEGGPITQATRDAAQQHVVVRNALRWAGIDADQKVEESTT